MYERNVNLYDRMNKMYDKMIKYLTSKNGYDLGKSTYTVETFRDYDESPEFYVSAHVKGIVRRRDGYVLKDPEILIVCEDGEAQLCGVFGAMAH